MEIFIALAIFWFAGKLIRRSLKRSTRALEPRSTHEQLLVTGYSEYTTATYALSEHLNMSLSEVQERLTTLPALMAPAFNPRAELDTLIALDQAGVECLVTDSVHFATKPPASRTMQPTTPTAPAAVGSPEGARTAGPLSTTPPPPSSPPTTLPTASPEMEEHPEVHEAPEDRRLKTNPLSAATASLTWATLDLAKLSDSVAKALAQSDPQSIERALRRSSLNGDHQADTSLGIFFLEQDRLDEAETAFRARSYDDPIAANNLGCLAYNEGKRSDARRHFNKAISLGSPEASLNLPLTD